MRGVGLLLVGILLPLSVAEWQEEQLQGAGGVAAGIDHSEGGEGGFSDADLLNILGWLSSTQERKPFIVVQVRDGPHDLQTQQRTLSRKL
jgi:hypothetical protein